MAIPREMRMLISATLLTLASCLGPSPPAQAMCAPATEAGRWENIDSATHRIVRIEVEMNCQDLLVNGEPWPPGFPWHIRIFARCGARQCDWGEAGGANLESRASDEIYSLGRFIRAVYDRGRVQYRVYLQMDPMSRQFLHAYVFEDFQTLGHRNFGRHYWFRNADPKPCTVPMTRYDRQDFLNSWFDCDPDIQGD